MPSWVPSASMPADAIRRCSYGKHDLLGNRSLLDCVFRHFQTLTPEVNAFALKTNTVFPKFASKFPTPHSCGVGALQTDFWGMHCVYAPPPWVMVRDWLLHVGKFLHLWCILIAPCPSSPWWPLLLALLDPSSLTPFVDSA